MTVGGADIFEEAEISLDLHQCPYEKTELFLDLVGFSTFLDYIYAELLNRSPDDEGTAYYTALHDRGISRAAIVLRLVRSPEHGAVFASLMTASTPPGKNGVGVSNRQARRINQLKHYASRAWQYQLPIVGRYLYRRHLASLRFERLSLHQRMLARQITLLQRESDLRALEEPEPFGFAVEGTDRGVHHAMFDAAVIRNRHSAQRG